MRWSGRRLHADEAETERLVGALARIHAKRTGTPAAGEEAEGVYRDAVRHFGRQERTLRQQARLAEAIVAKMRGVQGDVAQRALPIRAAAGGVAGGRFRLANELDRPARFAFAPRFALPCRFSPAEVELGAKATAVVDVRVDLADAPFAAGEAATLLVDVVEGGATRLKLWLDVRLDEGEGR